jgi:hypothetical protein
MRLLVLGLYLFSVAVMRVRGFGRGGRITNTDYLSFFDPPLHEVHGGFVNVRLKLYVGLPPKLEVADILVLAPELADAYQALRAVLDKLVEVRSRVLRSWPWSEFPNVDFESLPVEAQISLKRAAEIIVATALSRLGGWLAPAGSLLMTCSPRAVRFGAWMWPMVVHYSCRSHMGRARLELTLDRAPDAILIAELRLYGD